jgi:hypothetical protein
MLVHGKCEVSSVWNQQVGLRQLTASVWMFLLPPSPEVVPQPKTLALLRPLPPTSASGLEVHFSVSSSPMTEVRVVGVPNPYIGHWALTQAWELSCRQVAHPGHALPLHSSSSKSSINSNRQKGLWSHRP